MSPVVPPPTPFMIAGLASLLILAPLVAAAVLAFRGRRWWALAVGTAVTPMLLVGLYGAMSVRPARAAPAAESLGHWDGHRFEYVACESVADSHVELDPWHNAARRHDERLRRERDRRPPPADARHAITVRPAPADERVSGGELPAWVTDAAPANRLVVAGPLVTDEDGGPSAARRAAEALAAHRLIEAAGLPPGAAIIPIDVPRPGRVAVQTLTRTTGENTFPVYRGYVQIDASPPTLEQLREGHRRLVGEERAAWAAGAGGLCVALFAGLWAVGRRKLRHDSGVRGKA